MQIKFPQTLGAFQLAFKLGSSISTMAQTQNSYPANAESLADPRALNIKRPVRPQTPDVDFNG